MQTTIASSTQSVLVCRSCARKTRVAAGDRQTRRDPGSTSGLERQGKGRFCSKGKEGKYTTASEGDCLLIEGIASTETCECWELVGMMGHGGAC